MRGSLKRMLPGPVRRELSRRAQALRRALRARTLRRQLEQTPRRIVIGASGVFQRGWIPTDAFQLDLVRPETWQSYLEPGSVDALLAEHVWEHLTLDEGRAGAKTCYRYLRPGGYIRVAVPDGLYPDPTYREYIAVGGPGGGEIGGHRVVYTYRLLQEVFESAGFVTTLLEYHDEDGRSHVSEWNPADGNIHRSSRYDSRGPISIILDAVKQHERSAAPIAG